LHEDIVAPAWAALWACDVPIVGRILGACIGGGLEIAARCDLRISGSGGRFGAPIARLGFPMAPREPSVLARVVPAPVLRELLLEARLLDAPRALDLGLIHTVVDDADVAAHAVRRARSIAALSGQAPRINKQTMRHLDAGGPTPAQLQAHFAYADTAQHREGVMAFIEKRPPRFTPE
jgi:enoyl-CoA hydratase/carnithine racemase